MSLEFDITANISKMQASLNKAQAKLNDFAKNGSSSLDKFQKKTEQIGKGLSVSLTLPILALGAATIKAASDAEETASKFETVFRDISESANKSSKELRDSYGLSTTASKKLLSDTGDLLTGFGFTQKSALDLSTEVNKLAVDLASFTNFSGGAEGASAALTKALLGERESVKSLGISILEADVKAKVLENTKKGLTFESERQAKAFATLQIAQAQSANAIGDYARTSQGFANQTRLLGQRINDLAVEFGIILLPYVTKLTSFVTRLVDRFSKLDERTKKIILVVAGLIAVAGPLLLALSGIAAILPAIAGGIALLMGPLGLVVLGIAALTYAVIENWDTIRQWAQDIVNYFIDLYNESVVARVAFETFSMQLKNTWEVAKFVANSIYEIFKTNFKNLISIVKGFGGSLKALLTLDFAGLKKSINETLKSLAVNNAKALARISNDADKLWEQLKENGKKALDNILNPKTKNKVEFVVGEESKAKVKEDVAKAVAEGVNEGIAGRPQQQYVNALEPKGPQPVNALEPPLCPPPVSSDCFDDTIEEFNQFDEDLKNVINGSIANTLSQLGTNIGEALANGGSVLGAIGTTLIQGFGQFLSNMGDMLIKYGLLAKAKGAIDSALVAGGPASIAAGIAAVAIGVALKAAGGAIGSFANGGGGGGGTGGGTPSGATTTFSQSATQQNNFRFVIEGTDLVTVVDRARNQLDVIGG